MLGMKTLGRVFGTKEAMSEVVGAARDSLDSLVYTDEEKEHDAAKDRAEARSMVVEWMKSTQGQNVARRLIAVSITAIWGLMYLTTVVFGTISIFLSDGSKLLDAAAFIGSRATEMNGAVMLILAFYFAAPHMGQMVQGAMERFSKATGKNIKRDLDRTG